MPASSCRAASASAIYSMNAVSRSSVWRLAMSMAGVSHASTVPACIKEMRSQRRASFMKWVETKIVTPCAAREVDEQLPELVAGDRIDAGGRLVEQKHVGLVQDGDREGQPLLEPQREIGRGCIKVSRRPKRSTCSRIRAVGGLGGKSKILAWRSRFCRTESSP